MLVGRRRVALMKFISFLCLLVGLPWLAQAKPIRHCSAAYTLKFKQAAGGDVTRSVRMGQFRTTSRCPRRTADEACRKMARGRGHACMSSHWKKRSEEPPAVCRGRLKTYPGHSLIQRLIDTACSSPSDDGSTLRIVDIVASTFGASQCMGDAPLANDLKIDCRARALVP